MVGGVDEKRESVKSHRSKVKAVSNFNPDISTQSGHVWNEILSYLLKSLHYILYTIL